MSKAEAPLAEPTRLPRAGEVAPAGSRRLLSGVTLLVFLACLFVPVFIFGDDRYWLPLFSKYMALALFALSVDLVWGYTGLLSLGQGLYFGLGAYAVGYCLILRKAAMRFGRPLVPAPDMELPDFMEYCRLDAVPSWIAPLIDLRLALVLMILAPVMVAVVFGYLTFRLRIKGVFFSLVTQALVLAVFTLVANQQPYTGGVVGMRDIAKLELFGHKFDMVDNFYLTTGLLAVCFVCCYVLVRSKYGKVLTAIRDNEFRILALGYNTAIYKTFMFGVAAALAGLAGGLYVASQGTAGHDRFSIAFSIEIVIWVAVGGRGTLYGAVIGAILVNFAETYINNEFKDVWRYLLGALFVGTVVFLPNGIIGGMRSLADWSRRKRAARQAGVAAMVPVPEPASDGTTQSFPAGLPVMPPNPSLSIQAAPDVKRT